MSRQATRYRHECSTCGRHFSSVWPDERSCKACREKAREQDRRERAAREAGFDVGW